MLYELYYSRINLQIKISPIHAGLKNSEAAHQAILNPNKIIRHNDCCYISATRRLLVEYGRTLKQRWSEDIEKIYHQHKEQINSIKI